MFTFPSITAQLTGVYFYSQVKSQSLQFSKVLNISCLKMCEEEWSCSAQDSMTLTPGGTPAVITSWIGGVGVVKCLKTGVWICEHYLQNMYVSVSARLFITQSSSRYAYTYMYVSPIIMWISPKLPRPFPRKQNQVRPSYSDAVTINQQKRKVQHAAMMLFLSCWMDVVYT